MVSPLDTGWDKSFVFVADENTQVLDVKDAHVHLAVHAVSKGRSVYFSGLPYNLDNSRLLHRAIFWSSRKEDQLKHWFSSNSKTDLAAYPECGCYCVVNNVGQPIETKVCNEKGSEYEIKLGAYEMKWSKI